jgi:uncharacterized membrane protein (UPF0127 family)
LGFSVLVLGCQSVLPKPSVKADEAVAARKFPLASLKTVSIKIAKHTFKAWVMDSDEKREEGLMYVKAKDFADDQAMIFVCDDDEPRWFWMKNTEIPLDIAYFDKNRKLIVVKAGIPFSEEPVPSGKSAKYVVEANDGVFERLGIGTGAELELSK